MILVDSTPLVALCDPLDALHATAVRDLDRLARELFVVSDGVLTEALQLLGAASQRARLARLLDALPIGVLPDEHPAESRRAAFEWVARYAEHRPDWADATLVIATARLKKARVWTYDREFRVVWRRPDGTKVPVVPTARG